ncbi:DUF2075 domain-containing protein [Nonomuraea typhae]|uniref:DUF2075 domain-containing protein n=1 Tax=Nonomuraea typhae TaxID=2603600 RepID=A0ABW7YJI2_9ACTN
MAVLARELVDAELREVEVLVDFRLPFTSTRADAVLAGVHPETGRDSYVLIELKSWTQAKPSDLGEHLVEAENVTDPPPLNPIEQVRGYCTYMREFIEVLAEAPGHLSGVAYLYNALDRDVEGIKTTADEGGPIQLFTGQRREDLWRFLRERLADAPGAAAADRLLNSSVRPNRHLVELASEEIREREQVTLLDEQLVARDLAICAVENAGGPGAKEVVVVTGATGSGKSLIALSLLGELHSRGHNVRHATGSLSFTQTMRRGPGRGSTRIKNLFTYFNSFIDAEHDQLDVLICDEAHRIRETSTNRFTPAAKRTGRSQLDELMSAARVPIFLLDENQVVRPGERVNAARIDTLAESKGYRVRHVRLKQQFRSGGSEAYVSWVRRLLGLDPGGPVPWIGDPDFEVQLAESPWDLERYLKGKRTGTARIMTGLCWPWSDPRRDNTLVDDVVIGDWARPWHAKNDRAVGDAPPSMMWATDPRGFGQIGVVYTAQGFDFDWSGVILGPDLGVREGRLVTNREKNMDPAYRTTPAHDFDRLVRNVYSVLLTRGIRGTVIYAVDPDVQKLLTTLMPEGARFTR